ncbi:MAG: DUF924 family protein [Halocynthiibacter sp.]
MHTPEEVLSFWLTEKKPSDWYMGGEALDAEIRDRFETMWEAGRDGKLCEWTSKPDSTLALLILLDQFPRNMFRGTGKAFSTDSLARKVANKAIDKGWDKRVDEPQRQFFYMPLMHSECLSDQERCVRLMLTRMPQAGEGNLLHAKAHREVIRRFGRFPYRNDVLDRSMTTPEAAFIADGGYSTAVDAVRV